MLDIKWIRKERHKVEELLRRKDPTISLDAVVAFDTELRDVIVELETAQSQRNHLSQAIGEKKRQKLEVASLMEDVAGLGDTIQVLGKRRTELEQHLHTALSELPNVPFEEIPVSSDPKDNVCLKLWQEKPLFDFLPKHHVELNERLGLFDFPRATKVSGSRWPAYCGWGARLEWALLNYMMDIHIDNGFTLWMPPLLAKHETLFYSGNLPKFESQLFKVSDDDYRLYLIPTAEAVLNGLHADEILSEESLPRRYVAYTPCFRREGGSHGREERGLIRMHQFNKVEMFIFARPDQSEAMFDQMVTSAESILQGLGLHYRRMLLVTGDMSFAARKTIDLEAWLPGQGQYREVSSISHCESFQSRRSQCRYKHAERGLEYVHTLNGSGLATSRLMPAILETYQRSDGSVEIPLVLHKYLNGMKELCPPS